jgi:hypothetical protein
MVDQYSCRMLVVEAFLRTGDPRQDLVRLPKYLHDVLRTGSLGDRDRKLSAGAGVSSCPRAGCRQTARPVGSVRTENGASATAPLLDSTLSLSPHLNRTKAAEMPALQSLDLRDQFRFVGVRRWGTVERGRPAS